MRLTAFAFSLVHLGLYLWTKDEAFQTGTLVFLCAYMVIVTIERGRPQ